MYKYIFRYVSQKETSVENIYQKVYFKKGGEGLNLPTTETYGYQSCLINCDLGNPPDRFGGVRQRLLSPGILTTLGCIQKECRLYETKVGSVPMKIGSGSADVTHQLSVN